MALRYVLDENLRGPLWGLISRHNQKGNNPIDVVRVGDSNAMPLGTKDPELLRWAEEEGRILISHDKPHDAQPSRTALGCGPSFRSYHDTSARSLPPRDGRVSRPRGLRDRPDRMGRHCPVRAIGVSGHAGGKIRTSSGYTLRRKERQRRERGDVRLTEA